MVLESSSTTLTDIDPGTARAGWPEGDRERGRDIDWLFTSVFWDKIGEYVWTIGAWGTDEPRTDSFKTSQLIDKGRPISRSQFITRPRVIAGHGASVVMPDSGATHSPRTQCTSPRVGRRTNVANFMSSTILNYDWRWQSTTGWWFGTFFIFPCIGNNHPNWPIFFRGVQTTNQTIFLVFGLAQNSVAFSWSGICSVQSRLGRMNLMPVMAGHGACFQAFFESDEGGKGAPQNPGAIGFFTCGRYWKILVEADRLHIDSWLWGKIQGMRCENYLSAVRFTEPWPSCFWVLVVGWCRRWCPSMMFFG